MRKINRSSPPSYKKLNPCRLSTFISFGIILITLTAKPVLSRDYSADDFYPLSVGSEWQYRHIYYSKEMVGPDHSKILISSKAEREKGTVEFRTEAGTIFMYKIKDGILSASGFLILRDRLDLGTEWKSGTYNYNQRRHRVEAVGFTTSVGEKKYTDCIRVISRSDFHSVVRDGQTVYLSFESRDVYCSNVGPVVMETFEMTQSGGQKLVSRSELVSFKPGQAVKEEMRKEDKRFKFIEVNESFRFPEKGFYHPSLSPNDKWLIYHHSPYQDSSKGNVDAVWKQLFYSEVPGPEKRVVPLSFPNGKHEFENVGERVEWSTDGKMLALSARRDARDHIILVDFSGTTPKFLESFKGEKRSFQWADGLLLYIDEQGNLIKKFPNRHPETILNVGSISSLKTGIDSFRYAKDGTLLCQVGGRLLRTDLKNPEMRSIVHEGVGLSSYDLSPTGRFAFSSISDALDSGNPNARLYDLKAGKIYNLPVAVKKALFSPDGRKLAYMEKRPPRSNALKGEQKNPHFFILDMSNMEVRDYGFHISDYFGWTPEGNHIIYSMKCIHPSLATHENGIFLIRVSDGKEIAKLTSINAAESPVVSSSGKYIIWQGMDMDTFFVLKNPYANR